MRPVRVMDGGFCLMYPVTADSLAALARFPQIARVIKLPPAGLLGLRLPPSRTSREMRAISSDFPVRAVFGKVSGNVSHERTAVAKPWPREGDGWVRAKQASAKVAPCSLQKLGPESEGKSLSLAISCTSKSNLREQCDPGVIPTLDNRPDRSPRDNCCRR